jgi:homoserine kinase
MVNLRSDEVHIRVPASSANLGSAFDCAGLGLDLWDDIYARISDERGIRVLVSGVGEGELPGDCSHLVAQAMKLGFDALGVHPSGIEIRCVNHIPHGQGLGSSAAAIIGGFYAARALVANGPQIMSDTALLTQALALESHPDNLAGSLFGGLSIAWVNSDGIAEHMTFPPHPDIDVTLCIPSSVTPTDQARAALPSEVPLTDVVVNLGASAALVHAMTSDPSWLFAATRDAIHQHRRKACFSPSLDLMDALRAAGLPAVISGAGPAVLVFASQGQVEPYLPGGDWQICSIDVTPRGVHVVDEGVPPG